MSTDPGNIPARTHDFSTAPGTERIQGAALNSALDRLLNSNNGRLEFFRSMLDSAGVMNPDIVRLFMLDPEIRTLILERGGLSDKFLQDTVDAWFDSFPLTDALSLLSTDQMITRQQGQDFSQSTLSDVATTVCGLCPATAALNLQCVTSGEDLIIRCTDSIGGQNVTVDLVTPSVISGPDKSSLANSIPTNGIPTVDIVFPGTFSADTIRVIVDATIDGDSYQAQIDCAGIGDVTCALIDAGGEALFDVDGHPLCAVAPSTPTILFACGDDAGSPLGLTVTITADGGEDVWLIDLTPSLLVDGDGGSDPNDNSVVGSGTPTVTITYPTTFDLDTIRSSVQVYSGGAVFNLTHDCVGVRPTNYWKHTGGAVEFDMKLDVDDLLLEKADFSDFGFGAHGQDINDLSTTRIGDAALTGGPTSRGAPTWTVWVPTVGQRGFTFDEDYDGQISLSWPLRVVIRVAAPDSFPEDPMFLTKTFAGPAFIQLTDRSIFAGLQGGFAISATQWGFDLTDHRPIPRMSANGAAFWNPSEGEDVFEMLVYRDGWGTLKEIGP